MATEKSPLGRGSPAHNAVVQQVRNDLFFIIVGVTSGQTLINHELHDWWNERHEEKPREINLLRVLGPRDFVRVVKAVRSFYCSTETERNVRFSIDCIEEFWAVNVLVDAIAQLEVYWA